jgi:hypothetical protein
MGTRVYDVRVTALALGVNAKWVDNLLSHHRLVGCSGGGRGVERQITEHGLLAMAVAWRLNEKLGMPLGRAIALVNAASDGGNIADPLHAPGGIRIEVGVRELESRLRRQMVDALEAAPRIRRGRPKREK